MNYYKYVLSWALLMLAVHVSAISVSVAPVNITAGQSSEIVISLNNTETNLTAYQMSLFLPEGVMLKKKANGKYDYTLSARHENTHTMTIKDAADGSLLLVCSSLDKDVISGTSGELLRLPIEVASTVTTSLQAQLKSIIFSDVNSQKSYSSDVTFNLLLSGDEPPVVNPDGISVTVPDVQATAGSSTEIIVNLTNSANNLTAYQMSLFLPEGVTLKKKANGKYDYTLSDRHENTHTMTIKDAADGSLLLVCSSLDKDVISGTSGELLRLPIEVASTVTTSLQAQLKSIIFSDVNSQKSYPSDVTFNIVLTGGGNISNNITFADANVKALCVANWDSNGDGELSEAEAATVTDLGDVFKGNENINSFEELHYFVGLTSIGNYAFYGCSGLTSVTIPNSVTSIENCAFNNCSGLTSVTVKNPVPVSITFNVFSNRSNATLYVPVGSKTAYEAADYWKEFKEIIETGSDSQSGDLNGDGIINGIDLVAQTNLIMTDQYNAAADLNNDGVVNGLDYVMMVNLIMSFTSAPAMQSPTSNRAASTASLSIEDFDIKAGETKEMFINLSNPDNELTLLQFDMSLPEGLSIAVEDGDYAIDIAGRTTWKKHSLMAKATNGVTRFLLASNTNALIDGDNGNVISIKLTASNDFRSGDIKLENQLLVSPNAEDVMPADYIYYVGDATSIDGIMTGQPVDVYTLTGTKVRHQATSLDRLPKSVYVIKGKKVIVK